MQCRNQAKLHIHIVLENESQDTDSRLPQKRGVSQLLSTFKVQGNGSFTIQS